MSIPFRFIQCGDLHLGAPFKQMPSLGKYIDRYIVESTYESFQQMVNLAIREHVDAFLITGDIYNSEDHNLAAQVRFVRELERLVEARIAVFIVQGNHDPADSWQAGIALPQEVHVFSAKVPERVPLIVHGKEVAGVYGMSLSHANQHENIASRMHPLSSDAFSIALLHGTVGDTGVFDETAYTESLPTAPCTLEELRNSGFDYWAVGHIHKRSILCESPYVVYAGNGQGLHRKEQGPKGCYLVQVSSNGHCDFSFHATCPIEFQRMSIDISPLTQITELQEILHKKRELARRPKTGVLLKVTFTGSGMLKDAVADPEVQQLWMQECIERDRMERNFIVPFRFINETKAEIDWIGRRQLDDMVGDYLTAYDTIGLLPQEEKLQMVRELLRERPEAKRLGPYQSFLTTDLLQRALERAEVEGAMRLAGDGNED